LKHGKKFIRRKSKNPSRIHSDVYQSSIFKKVRYPYKDRLSPCNAQYKVHASYSKIYPEAGK